MIAALKIAFLAIVFFALAPLQLLALRLGSTPAGRLPVLFHRAGARMLGLKLRQTGAMAAVRPLLVVGNHTSWLDIVALSAGGPVAFVAKSEVAGWPIVRTLARLQRTLFVERARRHATGDVAAAIGARLAAGDAMVLFAEATTGDGARLLPYRTALFGAAQAAEGCFVQPVVVAYVRRNGLPVGRRDRPHIAWHGDMELLPHLLPLLSGGSLEAAIVWGEPRPAGTDRKGLAAELELWARETYARAIHGRL